MFDKIVRTRDEEQKKKKNKIYADGRRHADKIKPLQVGDKVLVQQPQSPKGKPVSM